ncbi:MAG TPA: hypothetical protein VM782_00735 [Stellaceae bacterium]|nr:hypothetical protein [Stellaceae bacterium]
MKRTFAVAIAFGATVATTGLALAQPAYGPNAATYYYPSYAAPPPPPAAGIYPPAVPYPYGYYGYDETHSGGGASRAYSSWGGGQKTN